MPERCSWHGERARLGRSKPRPHALLWPLEKVEPFGDSLRAVVRCGEDGANNLLTRNGARDYLIGQASAQWSIPIGKIPLTLGADVMNNFLNYDAGDVAPFPASDDDETFGFALSALLGQLKQRNDWLVGYYYSHIETFAVNASYAQDDWVRFGTGAQTASSDFKGHEIRLGYALSKNINLVARLYLVEAITTVQDGKRFRIDLNWKF